MDTSVQPIDHTTNSAKDTSSITEGNEDQTSFRSNRSTAANIVPKVKKPKWPSYLGKKPSDHGNFRKPHY